MANKNPCCSMDNDLDGNCKIHSQLSVLRPKYHELITKLSDIQKAERELEDTQHRYLRDHGWVYSSNAAPGSYWWWTKTHFGVRLMGSTHSAIQMETNISGYEYLTEAEMIGDCDG